ncbi:acid phosphatase [Geomonas limicola]|uniref:Acid phosphatase n=1 Tax=Geomonas limicola TaxID=2740186 RepID=A0A6V8N4Q7_9BACT|nr:phosphatase PAP2 family protein [Geomonas limicola]GFO66944.1 acid phosphatase [Geomonas limicola]
MMRRVSLILSLLVLCSFPQAYAAGPPDVSVGYVQQGMVPLPDSKVLLPPPPGKDSATLTADEVVSLNAMPLKGGKRWELAIRDADLSFPAAAATFSCALNVPVSEKETPHLYTLLRRSLADAANADDAAKALYNRPRPFLVNHQGTCTPDVEQFLRGSGSYPSGHSAIGWAWALILSEVAPQHADVILRRGLAFGESRIVCNVHWQSDVAQGRIMGASAVARLHASREFQEDLKEAKKEVESLTKKGLLPDQAACTAEADTLRLW